MEMIPRTKCYKKKPYKSLSSQEIGAILRSVKQDYQTHEEAARLHRVTTMTVAKIVKADKEAPDLVQDLRRKEE